MLAARIPRWCAALAVGLVLAPAAAAQDAGPQIDPDSPAGTEYELPLDRARERASGGSTGTPGSAGEAPLFGEGVENGSGSPDSDAGSRSGGQAQGTRGSAVGTSKPGVKDLRAQVSAPASDGGALVAIGLGAAGVLLLGGLAGLAWRRRSVGR